MPFLDSSSSGTLEAKYLKAKDEICYVSVLENINVLMFYKLIVGVKTVKFIVIKTLFNIFDAFTYILHRKKCTALC